ncbi:hypothetical protein T03_10782 [Trichinella britovi]|uniref:Uncharacterized protein n=1 Tax=Trichinella britovi TaxID=45882 RepID=A0A0V1D7V0_TRIBR|nr:hypothetical protein T03_10782 [Trichinella britovi]
MAKKARTICPQERATCSCRPCGKHDDHSWMDQLRPLGPTKRTKKKGRRAQRRKCGPVCENLERANRRACMLDAGKFNSKNEESSSLSRRRRRNYTRSQPSHCTLNAANVLTKLYVTLTHHQRRDLGQKGKLQQSSTKSTCNSKSKSSSSSNSRETAIEASSWLVNGTCNKKYPQPRMLKINVNKTDNSKSSGKEMFDELNSKIEKAMKQHNTDAYGTDKASTKVANSRKA